MLDLLFNPGGRIGRGQYWLGTLVQFVIICIICVEIVANLRNHNHTLLLLYCILLLLANWIHFCLISKRLHDCNKSAWLYLLTFIMGANFWLIFIECGMMAGSDTANAYGPPPGAGGRRRADVDDAAENTGEIDAMIARSIAARSATRSPGPSIVQGTARPAFASPGRGAPNFGKRR